MPGDSSAFDTEPFDADGLAFARRWGSLAFCASGPCAELLGRTVVIEEWAAPATQP